VERFPIGKNRKGMDPREFQTRKKGKRGNLQDDCLCKGAWHLLWGMRSRRLLWIGGRVSKKKIVKKERVGKGDRRTSGNIGGEDTHPG